MFMSNKDSEDTLRQECESRIQQMICSRVKIIESSHTQMETLRSFLKYLTNINQSQISSSVIPEIWEEMDSTLVLATKCNFYSILSDEKQEMKQNELPSKNIDDLKKEIKYLSDSQFELIQKAKKEINAMKMEAKELLKDILNKIDTDNNEKHKARKNQMLYYSPMFHRTRARKPIRCLVIDGGGLRGCLSIRILQALENKAREQSNDKNKKLCDLFDLIIGTSTGGLIALGLGMKKWSTQKVDAFYDKVAVDVFGAIADKIYKENYINKTWDKTKDYLWKGLNAWKPIGIKEPAKYDEEKLKQCVVHKEKWLEKKLDPECKYDDICEGGAGFGEDELMCDGKHINKPFVALVAVENMVVAQSYPLLLRNYDPSKSGYIEYVQNQRLPRLPGISNIKVWEAARATSAAPSYFRSILVKKTSGEIVISDSKENEKENEKCFRLVDGGLNANTPTLLAWTEASKLWPDREIFIYSVGTGTPTKETDLDAKETDLDASKTKKTDADVKNTNPGLLSMKNMAFESSMSGQIAQLFSLRVMASLDRLDLFSSPVEIDENKMAMDEWRYMKYWRERADKYLTNEEKNAKLDQMVSFLLKHQNDEHEEDIFKQAYMNV